MHDFELLNLAIDDFGEESLKQGFLGTRVYRWTRDIIEINNEVRFGWLTKQLHNALLDDPTPYRSEIKEFIVTLFDWFKFIPETFEIKKFNVSETVRIKSKVSNMGISSDQLVEGITLVAINPQSDKLGK